jgi:hypothetical protein
MSCRIDYVGVTGLPHPHLLSLSSLYTHIQFWFTLLGGILDVIAQFPPAAAS